MSQQAARALNAALRRTARRKYAFLRALDASRYADSTADAAELYTQSLDLVGRLRALSPPVNIDAEQRNADWTKEAHFEHVVPPEAPTGH